MSEQAQSSGHEQEFICGTCGKEYGSRRELRAHCVDLKHTLASVAQAAQPPEGFWEYLERNKEEVRKWPGWMRGEAGALTIPAQPQEVPAEQRGELLPETHKLVADFAAALSEKLLAAQKKYGHGISWMATDWMDECRAKLREHLEKGDPRDVANYCAFLWYHKQSTTAQPASAAKPLNSMEMFQNGVQAGKAGVMSHIEREDLPCYPDCPEYQALAERDKRIAAKPAEDGLEAQLLKECRAFIDSIHPQEPTSASYRLATLIAAREREHEAAEERLDEAWKKRCRLLMGDRSVLEARERELRDKLKGILTEYSGGDFEGPRYANLLDMICAVIASHWPAQKPHDLAADVRPRAPTKDGDAGLGRFTK